MTKACSIAGCKRKYNGKGYCAMHALRVQRYGDPHRTGAWQKNDSPYCKLPECGRPHAAKGFCNRHYQQQRKGHILPETLICQRCETSFERPFKGNPVTIRYCSAECRYEQQLEDYRNDVNGQKTKHEMWLRSRPEIIKANEHRRRARKRNKETRVVTEGDLLRLIARHGGMCAYCKAEPYSHIDHVVPLSRGGRHALGNLLPACAYCNLSKSARLLSDWRYSRGRDRVVI